MNNFFLEPLNSNSTIDHHTLNDSVQINVKNAENFDISFDALPSDPQMLTNILSLTTYSSEKYAIIALKSSAPYH
jgi:hypothetical protein